MAYLMDFNSMDGLDPRIVSKLNNNFRALREMLPDDEIVMVAQVTPPTPRTDETLWYKTDDGSLHIWAQDIDPNTGQPIPDSWSWQNIDIDLVGFGEGQPDQGVPDGRVFYYDTVNHLLWVYTGMGYWEPGYPEDVYVETHAPQWWTLQGYIQTVIEDDLLNPNGDLYDSFAEAVLDIVGA